MYVKLYLDQPWTSGTFQDGNLVPTLEGSKVPYSHKRNDPGLFYDSSNRI